MDLVRVWPVSAARFEAKLHEALAKHGSSVVDRTGIVARAGGAPDPGLPVSLSDRDVRLSAVSGQALFAIDPTCRLPLVARLALAARRAAILETKERSP